MEHTLQYDARTRLTLFEQRCGLGAYEDLIALLRQPCITFAQVGARFGVTRERVRQWHTELLPDAPKGRERRGLCRLQHARQRLLADPLFRAFYQQARASFPPQQINLIRTRHGLQARAARILGRLVLIKKARRRRNGGTEMAYMYALPPCPRAGDFVYYQLDECAFLFVPHDELPAAGTTFVDSSDSKYRTYRNSFAPLLSGHAARLAG
jgi:hypothetical protein